jgi:metal-sulfur cluster biosynthetic enzyme
MAAATGPTAWLNGTADRSMVATLLRDVIDPEIGVNIVDLGLVYAIRISDGTALVQMSLTTPGCPLSAYMEDSIHQVLWGSPGVEDVEVDIVWDPAWSTDMMSRRAKQELGWPE